MSKNINVNPGHYKVAGRERQGEAIIQEEQKQAFASQQGDGDPGVPPWEASRHTFVSAQPVEPEPAPPKKARKTRKPARKTAARKATKKPKRAARSTAKRRSTARSGKSRKGATKRGARKR